MGRSALIGLGGVAGLVAASGCFYTDVINQRPSLDIKEELHGDLYRGGEVGLRAEYSDPDGHDVFFHWRAYACTAMGNCDAAPYFESSGDQVDLLIAMVRADSPDAVRGIRVVLEGTDSFGATAKPAQEHWVWLANHAPTIELSTASSYGYVVKTPITIYARIGDEDDGPAKPALAWEVFSPATQPVYTFEDAAAKQDATGKVTYGKRLLSEGTGEFEVRLAVDDGFGSETSAAVQSIKILVENDKAPCLRQLSPLVAVAPSAWPLSEPTLFQVHVVADDLDPYPTVTDDVLGTTRFTWSLLAPGSTRQVLTGVTGSSVKLDPASFSPGDIVELRVEIADRKDTPILCADGSATCSVIFDNSCLQRQTWRVEVR